MVKGQGSEIADDKGGIVTIDSASDGVVPGKPYRLLRVVEIDEHPLSVRVKVPYHGHPFAAEWFIDRDGMFMHPPHFLRIRQGIHVFLELPNFPGEVLWWIGKGMSAAFLGRMTLVRCSSSFGGCDHLRTLRKMIPFICMMFSKSYI